MRLTQTVEVDCGRDELWPWIALPERLPQWMPNVTACEFTSGTEPTAGAAYKMTIREGGRPMDYQGELIEVTPPERLVLSLSGGSFPPGMTMRIEYALSELDPGQTRVAYLGEADTTSLPWYAKLMMPLARWMAGRQLRQSLDSLKAVAEDRGEPSAAADEAVGT